MAGRAFCKNLAVTLAIVVSSILPPYMNLFSLFAAIAADQGRRLNFSGID
ncbi:hypothetical protein J23TS9_56840 [Paenibacillus sp. J23TS9]|nr:hypothetical protein [Paenibacillus sp. J23TS9]GIP30554.1 hypothetical protein J23TS9_56840 [Paenibacillus sp. J23TS9]